MSDNLTASEQEPATQAHPSKGNNMATASTVTQLEAAAEIAHKHSKSKDVADGDNTPSQDDDGSPTKKAGAGAVSKESHPRLPSYKYPATLCLPHLRS